MHIIKSCTHRVFAANDSIVRLYNRNNPIKLSAAEVQPWPSVFFRVDLEVKHIIEDEGLGMRYIDPGAPFGRFETIPCTELCPERERIYDDGGDGVFMSKASAIVSGILELYPAVPLHAREGAANEFGRVAYQMLCDRRHARCMWLPVFVDIVVVSTAAASPPPSVVLRGLLMERHPVAAVSGSEEEEEEEEEEPVCAICLDGLSTGLSPGSLLARLPCSHFFHKICIARWLSAHPLCPLCRRDTIYNTRVGMGIK